MPRFKQFLIILGFFSCLTGFSQNQTITIKGKIDIALDGSLVRIGKSVDSFFNGFYTDPKDVAVVQNKRFNHQLLVSPNSFILIQLQGILYSLCYVDSASNISFEVMTDTIKNSQYIFFFGTNANANELLANRQLLNTVGRQKDYIVNIIKNAENAVSAMDSLHIALSSYTVRLDSLLRKNEISTNCYNAIIAEIEQRMLNCCNDVLVNGLRNPALVKMPKKQFRILIASLFKEYDPFNKKYFTSTSVSENIISECIFINEGILPAVINSPKDTWQSYAGLFTFLVVYFGVYDFAPNSYQQFLVGNALLAALNNTYMTKDEYMEVYSTYQKRYPASPYNPIINSNLIGKVFPATNNTRIKLDIH